MYHMPFPGRMPKGAVLMTDEYDVQEVQILTDGDDLRHMLKVQCKLLDQIRMALEKLVGVDALAKNHMVLKDPEVVNIYVNDKKKDPMADEINEAANEN